MNLFKEKLALLESRLQKLVEGGAKRAFGGEPADLSTTLLAAMAAGQQVDLSGKRLAPDLYILEVHPALAESLRENPDFLEELADTLAEAGIETGMVFPSTPIIRVRADSKLVYSQVNVVAEVRSTIVDDTSTVAVANGDESAIPRNAFLMMEGRRILPLNGGVINIGRRADNHIVVEDRRVSRQHAQLRAIQGQFVLFDLESTGGTFVNGGRVQQCALCPGDVISLAGVKMVYGLEPDDGGPAPAATQPMQPFPR